MNPLSYFSFQPVHHNWYNKACGMCYLVCGMVQIKEPLLLIGKSSPCGGSGFPLLLYIRYHATVNTSALNTFYLQLGDVELRMTQIIRSNLMPRLHGLLILISSKRSFICTIPQDNTKKYPFLHQLWSTGWILG